MARYTKDENGNYVLIPEEPNVGKSTGMTYPGGVKPDSVAGAVYNTGQGAAAAVAPVKKGYGLMMDKGNAITRKGQAIQQSAEKKLDSAASGVGAAIKKMAWAVPTDKDIVNAASGVKKTVAGAIPDPAAAAFSFPGGEEARAGSKLAREKVAQGEVGQGVGAAIQGFRNTLGGAISDVKENVVDPAVRNVKDVVIPGWQQTGRNIKAGMVAAGAEPGKPVVPAQEPDKVSVTEPKPPGVSAENEQPVKPPAAEPAPATPALPAAEQVVDQAGRPGVQKTQNAQGEWVYSMPGGAVTVKGGAEKISREPVKNPSSGSSAATAMRERFMKPVGRGATFAERGKSGFGARPQGGAAGMPLNTFGDVMRYKAALKTQKQENDIANETERTGILADQADTSRIGAQSEAEANAVTADKNRFELESARGVKAAQDEYLTTEDPARKKQLSDYLVLSAGKDPDKGNFEVVTQKVPVEPGNPYSAMQETSVIVDKDTKEVFPINVGGEQATVDPRLSHLPPDKLAAVQAAITQFKTSKSPEDRAKAKAILVANGIN